MALVPVMALVRVPVLLEKSESMMKEQVMTKT
jgi:hypothetical protein